MKKKMLMMAALLCCLMGFTACGSDDEPDPTVTTTYTVNFGADFFKVAQTAIIRYVGDNGTAKFEALNSSSSRTWTKTVQTSSYPARMGFLIEVSTVSESELTQDTYDVSVSGAISYSSTESSASNSKDLIKGSGKSKSEVISFLENNTPCNYGYILSRNGGLATTTISF